MRNISATSYNTYRTCPLQWKLKYVDGLMQVPNDALEIGTLYHEALEKFHSGGTPNFGDSPHKDVLEVLVAKYIKYPVAGDVVDLEYKFQESVSNLPVPIVGIIDRIDSKRVIEYKTSSKDYKDEDLDNIQTDMYSYAYYKRFGQVPEVIYSIMNKKKAHQEKYRPQELKIKRSKDRFKVLEAMLTQFYQNVKEERFYPTPSTPCYWCMYGKKGTNNCDYSL